MQTGEVGSLKNSAFYRLQECCSASIVLKICLIVFGVLAVGGALALFFAEINAIAAYVLGGFGGLLVVTAAVVSLVQEIKRKWGATRAETQGESPDKNVVFEEILGYSLTLDQERFLRPIAEDFDALLQRAPANRDCSKYFLIDIGMPERLPLIIAVKINPIQVVNTNDLHLVLDLMQGYISKYFSSKIECMAIMRMNTGLFIRFRDTSKENISSGGEKVLLVIPSELLPKGFHC